MSIYDFTVEETNLVAIYKADSKDKTLARIAAAYGFMDEGILTVAEGASRKLAALTEPEFSMMSFTPAGDDGE